MEQIIGYLHYLEGRVKSHHLTMKVAIIPITLVFGAWFISFVYRTIKVRMVCPHLSQRPCRCFGSFRR